MQSRPGTCNATVCEWQLIWVTLIARGEKLLLRPLELFGQVPPRRVALGRDEVLLLPHALNRRTDRPSACPSARLSARLYRVMRHVPLNVSSASDTVRIQSVVPETRLTELTVPA
jgi:hypothetical protein